MGRQTELYNDIHEDSGGHWARPCQVAISIQPKCPEMSGTVPEFFVLSPVPYGKCFCPGKIAICLLSSQEELTLDGYCAWRTHDCIMFSFRGLLRSGERSHMLQ